MYKRQAFYHLILAEKKQETFFRFPARCAACLLYTSYRPFSGSFFSHLVRVLRSPRSRFHHVGPVSYTHLSALAVNRAELGKGKVLKPIQRGEAVIGAVASTKNEPFQVGGCSLYLSLIHI